MVALPRALASSPPVPQTCGLFRSTESPFLAVYLRRRAGRDGDEVSPNNDNVPVARVPVRAEEPANDPAIEFIFLCCEGHGPARQKRIVVTARGLDIIDDAQATTVVSALGIEAA